jgi:hypothetical protein
MILQSPHSAMAIAHPTIIHTFRKLPGYFRRYISVWAGQQPPEVDSVILPRDEPYLLASDLITSRR